LTRLRRPDIYPPGARLPPPSTYWWRESSEARPRLCSLCSWWWNCNTQTGHVCWDVDITVCQSRIQLRRSPAGHNHLSSDASN